MSKIKNYVKCYKCPIHDLCDIGNSRIAYMFYKENKYSKEYEYGLGIITRNCPLKGVLKK